MRDHALEKTIAHALALDPRVDDDTIAVECFAGASDSTVTLSGGIDFPHQRDEAEEVARQVAGVSQVRNHLSGWIAVSPNEVLDRVADAIGVDSAGQLAVTARDNVVTLTGTVRSTGDRCGDRRGGGRTHGRRRRRRDPRSGVTAGRRRAGLRRRRSSSAARRSRGSRKTRDDRSSSRR